MIILLGLCYLCILVHSAEASCLFGDDCLFPCRCQDEAECNSNMGTCSECMDGFPRPNNKPDRFKWGGVACQTGNVAYNKRTDQSGVYGELISSRGVDGLLGSNSSQANCAHPDNDSGVAAWFYVDLESVHQIHNVTVFNTFNAGGHLRMVDFSIRVGNTSDVDKHAECARYDREAVKQGGDVTLDCSARGRYVSFRREGGDAIDLVTICEFIVIGHPLTTEDCPAGRTGTFCLDACEAGSFGVGCSEKCDENCKNDLCSADDGRCSNGCELWFAGDKCQDELRNPSIGGIRPSVAQLNVSAVSVTWTQDAKIPEKYAQYFGYRVYYAVGSFAFGGSTLGPTVAHDAAKRDQSLVVSNISAYKQYAFKVVPYRQIGGGRQYGFGSEAANIQLTTTAAAIPETATTPTSSSTASSNIKTTTKASKTVLPTDPNQTTKQNSAGTNRLPLIFGIVVGAGVAIALAVAVGVLLFRRKKANQTEKAFDDPVTRVNGEVQDVEPVVKTLVGSAWETDVEQHGGHSVPLAVDQLEGYVLKKKSIPDGFKAEYQRLPKSSIHPCEAGSKLKNRTKNRFADIKPFDATRVVLESDDTSHSDYINANYISGYKDVEKHYIATQGPKASTVVDFWRLLWQEKVNRIVMVTQILEMGKKKCELYWPCDVGTTEEFDTFAVTTVLKEEYADYAYLKFRVTHQDEERELHHFHFLSWNDKKRPEHTFPLIAFLRRVRSFDSEAVGPLVVHCSAGVGRTGTLIALDYLLEQAKAEEEVDVFGCVQQMQMQRMSMIQVLEQYVFVYEALLEALKSGETAIPCTEFPRTLKNIEDHNSAAHQQMCKEFELIRTYKDAIDLTNADGGKIENRGKNRYQDIIPMDLFRHRLDPRAVSVDGYRSLNAYLLIQMPLPETVSNFLHMIYSSDGIQSNVIVMLNALDEEDPSCASYWPNDVGSPVEHGGLRVDLVQEDADQHPNILIRDLTISTAGGKDPKPLKVRQFQLINCWSEDRSFPEDEKVLLTLMELVTRWQQQSGVAPVTVHCTNGVERSALFAIASYLMDMLKAEQVVDVYLASCFITSKCPLALPLLEQYQFLFELAGSFMSNFETYANFK